MCKFLAPNGAPSKLFDTVASIQGTEAAIKAFGIANAKDFNSWYGKGFRNELNEPIPVQGTFVSEKGEVKRYTEALSINEAVEQADRLGRIFSQYVKVDVIADSTIDENGFTIRVGDKVQVYYNPRKIQRDTLWHEFAHIYVDLLGYEHPIIQQGIQELRDSELWKEQELLYPELDQVALEKEILTTAIAIAAAVKHDAFVQYKGGSPTYNRFSDKLKLLLERIFRIVSELLGVTKPVAERLAYDLTAGQLKNRLTGTVSSYKQAQKGDVQKLIRDAANIQISADEKNYVVKKSGTLLERVTNFVELLVGEFDRLSAIAASVASNNPLYEKYVSEDEIARLWADKREEGTGLHGIAESYVNARNSGVAREAAKKTILANVRKPENAGALDEDGVRIYGGMNRDQVENYIDTILDFIDSLYAKGYKLYPEIKIYDEDLGVAGTIDLLVELPDGSYDIYDFKTKELVEKGGVEYTKFNTFNEKVGKHMQGVFGDLYANLNAKYSVQLSMYKLMLERRGMKVNEMHIVPLVGEIEERDGQFNYKSLKLYSDSNASNFKDGTFRLMDLSKRISSVAFGKEDIETKIKQATKSQELADELARDTKQLDDVNRWLKEVVVDLQRAATRLRRTADANKSKAYEAAIEELITRMNVTDEVEAIVAYTKYIAKTLFALHKKLNGTVWITRREGGVITQAEFKEGYSQMNWRDIAELEKTDYEQYMEFMAFLVNAEHFVSQVVKIKDIPITRLIELSNLSDEDKDILSKEALQYTREFENMPSKDRIAHYFKFVEKIGGAFTEAIADLKGYEKWISDIEISIKRLNMELDKRYIELSNNPMYKTGDLAKASEMFFKAQLDETFMQRNLDAMGDTHHTYIANVIKMYDYAMRDYRDEYAAHLREFREKTKGIDINRFVTEKGKLIEEVDKDRFREAMFAMYREYGDKYTYGSSAYRKAIRKWFAERTIPLTKKERDALIKRKKKELGDEDYKKWYNDQHYFSTETNVQYARQDKAFFKPNPKFYANEVYKALTPEERKALAYLKALFMYVAEHTRTKFFENGYIPAIPVDDRTGAEQIFDSLGWRDTHAKSNTADVDADGELENVLVFKFVNLVAQEPTLDIPVGASQEVKRDIKAKNAEIVKNNQLAHGAGIMKDLNVVVPLFLEQGLKHKYKKTIEFELIRVQKSLIENHKMIFQRNGKTVIDKAKKIAGLDNQQVEKSAENSRLLAHYKDWLRMVFYDDFEADEGAWTKIARILQNYTSFRGMAINPLSAINNQVYGSLMSRIEGWSGQYFNRQDWLEASVLYNKNIHNFFSDRDKTAGDFGAKASAFVDFFGNVLMDTRELNENPNVNPDVSAKIAHKAGKILGAAYMLNNISEHNLQVRLLFAMAKSHKIVNGKILSFEEFVRDRLEKFDPYTTDAEVASQLVAKNKEAKKNATEEWKKYSSVWSAFDLVQGQLQLKPEILIDTNEIADFERRVLGVNQYTHGIYNKEDAGAMQQYALGRLAIQFRKWMRPGWNKRWGARAFEENWNERRRVEEEGIYVTTMKFLLRPFYNAFDNMKSKEYREQTSTMQMLGDIVRDYGKFIMHAKVHWHSLTDTEKSNVIRTMLEWASLAMAIGLLYMLKYIKGEDDEEQVPKALMLTLYQIDRTATELTTFVPLAVAPGYVGGGWMNETKKILKSPTATFNAIENLFTFGKTLIMYPFWDEEQRTYQTGVYNNEDKLKVSFIKLVPIWNQINRMDNLDRNYRYYKLF